MCIPEVIIGTDLWHYCIKYKNLCLYISSVLCFDSRKKSSYKRYSFKRNRHVLFPTLKPCFKHYCRKCEMSEYSEKTLNRNKGCPNDDNRNLLELKNYTYFNFNSVCYSPKISDCNFLFDKAIRLTLFEQWAWVCVLFFNAQTNNSPISKSLNFILVAPFHFLNKYEWGIINEMDGAHCKLYSVLLSDCVVNETRMHKNLIGLLLFSASSAHLFQSKMLWRSIF